MLINSAVTIEITDLLIFFLWCNKEHHGYLVLYGFSVSLKAPSHNRHFQPNISPNQICYKFTHTCFRTTQQKDMNWAPLTIVWAKIHIWAGTFLQTKTGTLLIRPDNGCLAKMSPLHVQKYLNHGAGKKFIAFPNWGNKTNKTNTIKTQQKLCA